ncbi:MAG: hypothetical protein H6608_11325 [Flavobacteriales bacterium]|nr:hypothetical protein [Bacteroidota bacterium]MCB9241718.1 hypothetical protein [Flavobacteriales bacterium]
MRKLKYMLFVMMIAPMIIIGTGCGGDEPTPTPTPTDTTAKDTVLAGFKAGFDKYELVLDNNQSDGHYRAADGKTIIFIVGYSEKAGGGVVDGKGEVEIVFPGKTTGSFSQSSDDVTLEVATGTPPSRIEYSYDANSNIKVNITEYGEVGGKIKGTFSGTLKSGINSRDISGGYFEVVRSADQ